MAINESGHQASPFEIDHHSAGCLETILAQRKNSSATDQQVAYTQVLRREDIGVLDQRQHGEKVRSKKGRYTTTTRLSLGHLN